MVITDMGHQLFNSPILMQVLEDMDYLNRDFLDFGDAVMAIITLIIKMLPF